MKKIYLILAFMVFVNLIQAQVQSQFSDDFESYTVGSYLAQSSPKWTTWSGGSGGADDVKITNTDAFSGTKSVYFQSTVSGGGPEDIVLPFDSLYTKGHLQFDVWMKVDAGKGAYFNLQGDQIVGSTWALSAYFIQTGALIIQDASNATVASTTYPPASWFKLTLDIDFFTNTWKVKVNDVVSGTWSNSVNRAASIDFYPTNSTLGGNNLSGFYIDDVSLIYTPYVIPPRNGALNLITYNPKLVNQISKPSVTIENKGTDTIKSFDVVVNYGNNTFTESFTSVSIPFQTTSTFKFSTPVTAILDTMVAYITNVNGMGTDLDPSNDTARVIVNQLVTPETDKLVIVEMVTGTGYGWAPKGIVALDDLAESFSGFIYPINIHSADPMEDTLYLNGISPKISQYPSALINRGQTQTIDPSFIEDDFIDYITEPAIATLSNSSRFINDKSNLEVNVVVDFKTATTGNYALALVITEDGVTGSDTSYAQKNNYSSGTFNIPLKGAGLDWQQQPDPVPASAMVYNNVARYIAPDFAGEANIFPTSINAGDTFHHSFRIEIDSTLNLSNFNIIAMLIKPSGEIDNATVSDLSGAQVIIDSTGVGIQNLIANGENINLYPNPSKGLVTLEVELTNMSDVAVKVMDVTGKTVFINYLQLKEGLHKLPLNLTKSAEGVYFVHMKIEDKVVVQKLILTK